MNLAQRREVLKKSVKWSIYELLTYLRLPSAAQRVLPDFVIAGAQKSGTTSLYASLNQHPDVMRVFGRGEVHFWDYPRNYKKGLLWYRAHFPLLKEMQTACAITGEKTPNYLENPDYIRRIKQDCPAVKIIILLRNPVDRTISNYYMKMRRGFEDLPLMEALLREDERLASLRERKQYGIERAYKIRGIYAPSIKTCLENFPPEQRMIIDSNVFFKTPGVVLKDVCDLLGISPARLPELAIHKNLGSYDKADIPSEVYTYLRDFFRPHNEELYALLGHDFGWENQY